MAESYRQEDTALSLKVVIALSRTYRHVMDISNESVQQHGLHPTEFGVLELLYHKGPQPLQQIGGRILLASGSITYVIDKLEKRQLVVRQPCQRDRRVIYAKLTEAGTEFMRTIFPDHERLLHQALSALSAAEKEELLLLLKKISQHP